MLYSEPEKLIYVSPLETKYDPLAVQRKLIIASNGTINNYLSIWSDEKATELEKANAEEFLVAVARKAFNLPSFDEDNSVTDDVVLNCLTSFLEWLEGNGKRE